MQTLNGEPILLWINDEAIQAKKEDKKRVGADVFAEVWSNPWRRGKALGTSQRSCCVRGFVQTLNGGLSLFWVNGEEEQAEAEDWEELGGAEILSDAWNDSGGLRKAKGNSQRSCWESFFLQTLNGTPCWFLNERNAKHAGEEDRGAVKGDRKRWIFTKKYLKKFSSVRNVPLSPPNFHLKTIKNIFLNRVGQDLHL